MCGFADTMVLDAKEGYAPSIAPSPFKRHGGLKILLDYNQLIATNKVFRIEHIMQSSITINGKIIILIIRKCEKFRTKKSLPIEGRLIFNDE